MVLSESSSCLYPNPNPVTLTLTLTLTPTFLDWCFTSYSQIRRIYYHTFCASIRIELDDTISYIVARKKQSFNPCKSTPGQLGQPCDSIPSPLGQPCNSVPGPLGQLCDSIPGPLSQLTIVIQRLDNTFGTDQSIRSRQFGTQHNAPPNNNNERPNKQTMHNIIWPCAGFLKIYPPH